MPFAAFLVAMVGPMLTRLLTALGVSLITITGLVAATSALKSTMTDALGGIPGDGLQLAGLFGIWTCVGMCTGAITFVITWKSTQGFMALAKT